MISLDELGRFYRLYLSLYRIEHDVSLVEEKSLWSYQLRVEPPLLSQTTLLRKIYKWADISVDQDSGALTVKGPVATVKDFPDVVRLFSGLSEYASGLQGANLRLQLLVAPIDRDYRSSFTRDQAWEWLHSSSLLTELYLVGVVGESGAEFTSLFHSCHQADMNRDISEDSNIIMSQWAKCYQDVCGVAGVVLDSKAMAHVTDPAANVAPKAHYKFPCEDLLEASRLYNLCSAVDIEHSCGVKLSNSVVTSGISCINLADLVFSLRFAVAFSLFGSDPDEG